MVFGGGAGVARFTENDSAVTGEALNALYTAVGWNERGNRTPEKSALVLAQALYFVAAWEGDRLVGFGRISGDVYAAQIMDVMTHPNFRRCGVAREVVAKLVRYADSTGLPLLLVAAGDVTTLYKGFGFLEADPKTDVLMYRSP